MSKEIKLAALTTIESATGKTSKVDGKTIGTLTLKTAEGNITMTLDEFDAVYRGMVNCWPAVTPLKQEVISAKREEVKEAKEEERKRIQAEKQAEKDKAKAEREAAAAKAKADKEAAKQKAKEEAEAKKKAEADAKAKADKEKAKKAADKKAKDDKK